MSSSRETIIQEKNIYDIVINKYQSAGKGLSVKHWQRNIELCQICAGEYEFVVGKQYFLAHKGDIVFIPAGELHQLGSNDISSSNYSALKGFMNVTHCLPPFYCHKLNLAFRHWYNICLKNKFLVYWNMWQFFFYQQRQYLQKLMPIIKI